MRVPANIFAFLLLLLTVATANAAPHISDFSLGLSRSDIMLRPVTDHGDHYCGEVGFGGQTWSGAFIFADDVLTAISLAAPLDEKYLEAAMRGFAESSFSVYQVVSDVQGFDFAQLTRQGYTPDEVDRAFTAFLNQLPQSGSSFCTFFYAKPAVLKQIEENGACLDPTTSVSCSLTIDQEGLTIIMMSWQNMQHELNLRVSWAQQTLAGKEPDRSGSNLVRLPAGHQRAQAAPGLESAAAPTVQ